jgi:hypothetical protein
MLITRRKRKEHERIAVYINNKSLEQVEIIKYLGIIIDSTIHQKVYENITRIVQVGKIKMWIKSQSPTHNTQMSILPLMLYGVPIWIKALEKECNRKLYNRVQRLIKIKITKAFRTTSNEALCTMTGRRPIVIRQRKRLRNLTL